MASSKTLKTSLGNITSGISLETQTKTETEMCLQTNFNFLYCRYKTTDLAVTLCDSYVCAEIIFPDTPLETTVKKPMTNTKL